jgi:HD-like signal output (HDOD) protein
MPSETTEKEAKIASLFERVTEIPPLPNVTRKILEVIENPLSSAQELSQIISRDPSLTSQILKSANSAFYGYPNQIGTIHLATVILGFSTIRTISLGACVLRLFSQKEASSSLINQEQFWAHSLKCAVACKLLASKYKYYVAGEAFTTGILHDIGRLVLAHFTPKQYEPVLQTAREQQVTLLESEQNVLGFNHADISGYLLEKWKLPAPIVDAVKYHHQPALSQTSPDLASIAFIGDYLSHLHSYRVKEEMVEPQLKLENWGTLAIPLDEEETIEQLLTELTQELNKAAAFFKILKGEA